jgi:hypothetical protein
VSGSGARDWERPACRRQCCEQYHKSTSGTRWRNGAGITHIVVQIIQLLVAIGLTAAVTAVFALAVISVVHGLRATGRQR